MRAVVLALAAAALLSAAHADLGRGQAGQAAEMHGNPIRKVVTLLQKMQVKVSAEGEKEKELYEKFECYCKKGDAELSAAVSAASGKVPEVISAIREQEAKKVQLEQDLKDHQTGRSEAKEAIAKATAIREKDAAAHGQESAEYKSNVAALKGAIEAVSKGMAGGFLQTSTAQIIRRIALSGPPMNDVDRQDLLAFMQGGGQDGYMPRSGEITGILNQLKDEMDKSLADITDEESTAISQHEELMAAKGKEIQALTTSIEQKSQRVGELAISIVMAKNDLSDTEAALAQDQELLAGLTRSCEGKAKEWEARQATRAEELVALAEVIKVLNDDDALELFKKTLPSAAFVQVGVNTDDARTKARSIIAKVRAARRHSGANAEMDLIAMALHGKKIGVDKIVKMVDDLVAQLKKEQVDDEAKKGMCEKQLDTSDDKKKALEQEIADHETAMEDAEGSIATVTEEIKALAKGIKELDKSVAEATEQRKAEHAEFQDLLAGNGAAKEVLAWAKNRLAKYYTPKLYKSPPKRELAKEGEAQPVLAQVSAHVQRASKLDPAPETFGEYSKKSQESMGVVAMIDLLVKDLDKEITEAETEERDAQGDYETLMVDSAAKRAADSKALTQRQTAKAATETALESHKEGKASSGKELMAVVSYIKSLHAECDWLLQYFDQRKEARSSEIESLGGVRAVLNGADFSFVQRRAAGLRLRH